MLAPTRTVRGAPDRHPRRGVALLLVLILSSALGALALSAISMASNSTLLGTSSNKERDLRYAAEAALAMGKSRLNNDAYALPDSAYVSYSNHATLNDAAGVAIPGLNVSVYAGPTGTTTGQFGRFASVVAVAEDGRGSRVVRRLELAQENFAKFAYWSNKETNVAGTVIYFNSNDQLWGPVWSNDNINIGSGGATFHNDVGTAKVILGKTYGTFDRGYVENQKPITLPSSATLQAKLPGYAAAGGFSFAAPNNLTEGSILMRIEFVNVDLDASGDANGVDEGFFRVYTANAGQSAWLRGDWNDAIASSTNCGDFHPAVVGGPLLFFPASVHNTAWFQTMVDVGGMTAAQATAERNATLPVIMGHAGARCYLGGDPHLIAVERASVGAAAQIGGADLTTFAPVGDKGSWRAWGGPVDPRLVALGRPDRNYLFPLYRGLNAGTKGVIYSNGSVGISGTVRGRVTLYSNAYVVVLDDVRYGTDPTSPAARCADILGIISTKDVVVADNTILEPQDIDPSGGTTTWKNLDDTKDLDLNAVIMATGTSFRVQNHDTGPTDVNDCDTQNVGRGCLFLTGGLIQDSRGAVGTSGGTGFVKRYSYDRCAAANPPPYFPTTGRYLDNRYYELDPSRFNVDKVFKALQPNY